MRQAGFQARAVNIKLKEVHYTMATAPIVRILRPSLDDFGTSTVLRGIISTESIYNLNCDFYQREKLSEASRREIMFALDTNTQLPDIELGHRGDHFAVSDGEPAYVDLLDPVFIIDGRQRVETLRDHLKTHPASTARLGAIVHFNTTPDWERSRFHTLNSSRIKVAPSVLLRNIKEDYPAIATLYGLTQTQSDFPLYRRVVWRQSMGNNELITAITFARNILRLHSHLVPSRQASSAIAMAAMFNRLVDRIGLPLLRQNIISFWRFMDDVWQVSRITSRNNSSTVLRSAFLTVLADIFSGHIEFWTQPDECRLQVPYTLKQKFMKFPIYDPEIVRLSGATGKAMEALYFIMATHLNSGKRTKRLVPRNVRATIPALHEYDPDEDHDADEDNAA